VYKNKKILAVIPARGGSKEIPRKNIRLLAGKPLIAYTIEAALKSKYVDKVIVSTEDIEISQISEQYGAEVVKRPEKLARDETPTLSVIQHVVRRLKEKYDIIVALQPTSPLRDEKDIDAAIDLFGKHGTDSLVSVCEVEHHPYWMVRVTNGKVEPFVKTDKEYPRRQDLPKLYRFNGAIYIAKKDILMKENKIFGKNATAFIMPLEKSIDIDTELDFKLAEILMKSSLH